MTHDLDRESSFIAKIVSDNTKTGMKKMLRPRIRDGPCGRYPGMNHRMCPGFDPAVLENLGDGVTPECHDHRPLEVPGPPGPAQGQPLGAAELGAVASVLADPVSAVNSQSARGTGSAGAAASRLAGLPASDAGVAARLADLAVAAAFAGGLGVGGELDGFLARAAELLDGEADSLGRGGVLLVAQVLAGDVAEVPGLHRVTAPSQNLYERYTTRAA